MSSNESLVVKKQVAAQNVGTKSAEVQKKDQEKAITIFDNDINQASDNKPKDGEFWKFKGIEDDSFWDFSKKFNDKGSKLRPPLIDQETRDSLDKDLIIGLYKNMTSNKLSEKNTTAITQGIHRIDNLNYLKAFKSIEYGPLGMELPEMILACPHLNETQKRDCLKHLTKVGKTYADRNNQRSDDIIPKMEKIFDATEKTKIINETDKQRLLADFRKITDRQDTLRINKPLPPNGKLDGSFKQGNTGDCWLLAGIQSLSLSPEGKKLMEDNIKVDKDGNATVTFKGIGKTYKVSARDIKCSNNLSSGDSDIRAMEIAMDRYFRDSVPKGKSDLKGNTVTRAFELLTDKKNIESYMGREVSGNIGKLKNNMSKKAANTAIGGNYDTSWMNATVDGKKVKIYTAHAYTVSKVDDSNIYLVNPHDTSKTIKMPLNEYKKIFNLLGIVNL